MKKLFALVLLSVLALSGQAFAQKTYVNGIDPNYPPFAYIDEKRASRPALTLIPLTGSPKPWA